MQICVPIVSAAIFSVYIFLCSNFSTKHGTMVFLLFDRFFRLSWYHIYYKYRAITTINLSINRFENWIDGHHLRLAFGLGINKLKWVRAITHLLYTRNDRLSPFWTYLYVFSMRYYRPCQRTKSAASGIIYEEYINIICMILYTFS